MRVFVAGATGVVGTRLVPLLIEAGHTVAGMTRSPEKRDEVLALGAEPVVCDVFDADALARAVAAFAPDCVMHQLTDLPDREEHVGEFAARNDRIRTEGTANLIAAARAAGMPRFIAQSIAWKPPGRGRAVESHEQQVLDICGVVVRYGRFYGPGTYYEDELPRHPRIAVEDAARRTVPLLEAASAVIVLADDAD